MGTFYTEALQNSNELCIVGRHKEMRLDTKIPIRYKTEVLLCATKILNERNATHYNGNIYMCTFKVILM